ncbi:MULTISPECIES: DUF397 domain-containing protein [unclassified Streptomyces]|uniref:DUF397 domain-containing protein n=1 Tax=unclassified Streptomyces TaxID=2593676 RepID=UPI002253D98D|nr:DUF397 domain-containing protein [Streptomyces sp. NBC_01363]MCX4731686.1 DUF397 domain-containing protein [Streptomyces sp. NBC_01363]
MIRKSSAGDASGLEWFKSSFSDSSDGNDCVEVAAAPGTVHVRDSKNAQGPRLAFGPNAWTGFVSYAAEH